MIDGVYNVTENVLVPAAFIKTKQFQTSKSNKYWEK
jgi:hypothetical protein